ncbi:hypothetical protein DINM_002704 [Dirofilaria immitis]|nr:hypothetical protein [Dirofilaria immitis]
MGTSCVRLSPVQLSKLSTILLRYLLDTSGVLIVFIRRNIEEEIFFHLQPYSLVHISMVTVRSSVWCLQTNTILKWLQMVCSLVVVIFINDGRYQWFIYTVEIIFNLIAFSLCLLAGSLLTYDLIQMVSGSFAHHRYLPPTYIVFTGTANSVTRTSKTYHDDVRSPGLSKSRSVPRTSSEKSLEATQAETMKLIHQSHSKSKSLKLKNLDPLQHEEDIVQRKEEQDSFATHIPKKRVARRSTEIKSRPPVRCDRDDYKTIPAHMLPSSTDDL